MGFIDIFLSSCIVIIFRTGEIDNFPFIHVQITALCFSLAVIVCREIRKWDSITIVWAWITQIVDNSVLHVDVAATAFELKKWSSHFLDLLLALGVFLGMMVSIGFPLGIELVSKIVEKRKAGRPWLPSASCIPAPATSTCRRGMQIQPPPL